VRTRHRAARRALCKRVKLGSGRKTPGHAERCLHMWSLAVSATRADPLEGEGEEEIDADGENGRGGK